MENRWFYPSSLVWRACSGNPLDCRDEILRQKTRIVGLPDGEEIMMLTFFVLTQYRRVTDGRTDTLRSLLQALAQRRVCIKADLTQMESNGYQQQWWTIGGSSVICIDVSSIWRNTWSALLHQESGLHVMLLNWDHTANTDNMFQWHSLMRCCVICS